jgi:hypothetical protein
MHHPEYHIVMANILTSARKPRKTAMGFSLMEVSISPSHDWQARTSPAIEARERAVPTPNVLGIPEMT